MSHRNTTPHPLAIPSTRQVLPGALVSIVLKADQATGTQVQGIVAAALTRGEHPRGIKVRLADGRVGRVQRMVGDAAVEPAGSFTADGRPVAEAAGSGSGGKSAVRAGRWEDVRLEEQPRTEIGLDAYLKPARKGKRGKVKKEEEGGTPVEAPKEAPASAACPVCGEFNGDEAAVAHHVEGHFA